jgi:hypothetical protein
VRRDAILAPALLLVLVGLVPGGTAQATTPRSSAGTARQAASAGACAPRPCAVFRVKITFTQKRPWTYYHQQVAGPDPICTRTAQGNGLDVAKLHATGFVTLPLRNGRVRPGRYPVANVTMQGTHTRTGVETHTVAGAECAPTAVFPSTWRIVSEVGGTVTAAESVAGCGTKPVRAAWPSLVLAGTKLRLDWSSYASPPDFKDCPLAEGASDVPDDAGLPSVSYLDLSAPVSLAALGRRPRRIAFVAKDSPAATETCGTLISGCPEGVTYNATATIDATATYVFVRLGP